MSTVNTSLGPTGAKWSSVTEFTFTPIKPQLCARTEPCLGFRVALDLLHRTEKSIGAVIHYWVVFCLATERKVIKSLSEMWASSLALCKTLLITQHPGTVYRRIRVDEIRFSAHACFSSYFLYNGNNNMDENQHEGRGQYGQHVHQATSNHKTNINIKYCWIRTAVSLLKTFWSVSTCCPYFGCEFIRSMHSVGTLLGTLY